MADVQAPGILRSEVSIGCVDDAPRDYWVNVIHHHYESSIFTPSTDYTNHANEILQLYTGQNTTYSDVTLYEGCNVTVKVFDLGDPGSESAPRQPHATVVYTPTTVQIHRASMGPGQIAACLSFTGGGNIQGHRGRLYVGGIGGGAMDGPYVPASIQDIARDLGHGLFDIGGENISHVIYHPGIKTSAKGVSPTTYGPTKSGFNPGSYTVVDTYFVANEWATVRRRAVRATGRVTITP